MKLSIVTTLYKSSAYVSEFLNRISVVAEKIAYDDYEIIMVNDGCPDGSVEVAVKLSEENYHVKIVDLSRNFGHHKAMMTGLSYSQGEVVFLIDSDLEEDPEWLLEFNNELNSKKCDVVYGTQLRRKGGLFERLSGKVFYWFFRLLTGFSLPAGLVTARLMNRRYVDALLLHKEREVFLAGLWHITGFDQHPKAVIKRSRGESSYTLKNKFSLLINSITSFSIVPLVFIFYTGLAILFTSFLYIFYILITYFLYKNIVTGWTSLIVSIWLIGGITLSSLGVIGIYLAKMFSETKQRPYTIVKDIHQKPRS